MNKSFAIICIIFLGFNANAQWTGQSSSTDLASPISRTGMIYLDGYNGSQIRLNSTGTYYGKIGNPSPQVWSLGWGATGTDINPVLNWTATGSVGIGTVPSTRLDIFESGGGSGTLSALRIRSGNDNNYFGNNQILFSYNGGTGYSHAIKTRHNSASVSGNALDFYVWKPGDAVNAVGSNLTMTLDGGNVGIGTATPAGQLEIKGPYNGNSQVIINTTSTSGELRFSDNDVAKGFVWYSKSTNYMAFGRGSASNSLFVDASGNFSIGTSTPSSFKLAVEGKIYGKEVQVALSNPGPDYVFDEDYKLTPLEHIKTYIDQNKHLPDVPSAKEMETNGIQLGEMNMLLLKKIEELTLYVIEQNSTIQKQNERITKLETSKQN